MSSNAEMVKRCLAGEAEAFRPIVERYQNEAYAHALTLLRNEEDALDAIQEAFWDAFQALSKFEPNREFYPWFYVLLRNRCFKMLRSRKRRQLAMTELAEHASFLQSNTVSLGEVRDLEEALWSLDVEDREIITLRHFDGLSYAELAQRLAIPMGTVMSRLFHARRRLRAKLQSEAVANKQE